MSLHTCDYGGVLHDCIEIGIHNGSTCRNLSPPKIILSMFNDTALQTVGMLTARAVNPRTSLALQLEFYITINTNSLYSGLKRA